VDLKSSSLHAETESADSEFGFWMCKQQTPVIMPLPFCPQQFELFPSLSRSELPTNLVTYIAFLADAFIRLFEN
jgi:hypothetical protein